MCPNIGLCHYKNNVFKSNYAPPAEDCMYYQGKCFTLHDYLMCIKYNYVCYVGIKIIVFQWE